MCYHAPEVFPRAPRTRDRSETDAMSGEAFLAAHKNSGTGTGNRASKASGKLNVCRNVWFQAWNFVQSNKHLSCKSKQYLLIIYDLHVCHPVELSCFGHIMIELPVWRGSSFECHFSLVQDGNNTILNGLSYNEYTLFFFIRTFFKRTSRLRLTKILRTY